MPRRKRRSVGGSMQYPDAVFMRLEGTARYAFAIMYQERRRADEAEHLNNVLVDRVETIVPELLGLVDDVLYERNPVAFYRAYRIKTLVEEFVQGARK